MRPWRFYPHGNAFAQIPSTKCVYFRTGILDNSECGLPVFVTDGNGVQPHPY